jgi:hypothetical protein
METIIGINWDISGKTSFFFAQSVDFSEQSFALFSQWPNLTPIFGMPKGEVIAE